jgi:CheY-like chemotaxis protein
VLPVPRSDATSDRARDPAAGPAAGDAVSAGPQGEGRRVTVVNDNPDFLELMRELLAADRYTVTLVNGDKLSSIDPIVASRPELLFVDLRLSSEGLKGWAILTEAAASGALADVPIVICTAAVYEVRQKADEIARLPNVEVLTKPFDLTDLEALLGRLLP